MDVNENIPQGDDVLLVQATQIDAKARRFKYLATFFICFGELAYGMINASLVSSALIDLSEMIDTTTDQIAVLFTVNNIGYTIGALFGIVYRFVNRQALLILMQLVLGFSIASLPQSRTLLTMAILYGVNGISCGAWDCGQTVWVMEMWQDQSGPILQLTQFIYGVGAIISPLLVKSFITHHDDSDSQTSSDVDNVIRSRLEVPFAMAGLLSVVVSVMIASLFICRRWNKPLPSDKTRAPETARPDLSVRTTNWVVVLTMLLLTAYCSSESMAFSFIPTFAYYSSLHLSKPDAALLLSAFSASYAACRGLSVFTSMKFKPQTLLLCHFVLLFSGHSLLLLCGDQNLSLLWLGCIIIGAGYSGTYPNIYSFLERTIPVSNLRGSLFIFSGGLLTCLWPLYIGAVVTSLPMVVFLVTAGNIVFASAMFWCITVLVNWHVDNTVIST